MPKPTEETTLEDAKTELSSAVYVTTALLESLEHLGLLMGNGHHARQAVAKMATDELERRWLGATQ